MDKTEAFDSHGTQTMGVKAPLEDPNKTAASADAPHHEEATHQEANSPKIIRPTGISWVTLTLGLLCLGLAALVLTLQLADVTIDWSTTAPVFVVSAGALLVIAGIAGMATKGRHDT